MVLTTILACVLEATVERTAQDSSEPVGITHARITPSVSWITASTTASARLVSQARTASITLMRVLPIRACMDRVWISLLGTSANAKMDGKARIVLWILTSVLQALVIILGNVWMASMVSLANVKVEIFMRYFWSGEANDWQMLGQLNVQVSLLCNQPIMTNRSVSCSGKFMNLICILNQGVGI